MNATKELLCVLDALLKLLESYYAILRWFKWIGGSFKFILFFILFYFIFLGGANYRAPWRDFMGTMGHERDGAP
jgi:hypothetical protein